MKKDERRRLAAAIHAHQHAAEYLREAASDEHHAAHFEFEGKIDRKAQKIVCETLAAFADRHEADADFLINEARVKGFNATPNERQRR